MPKVKTKPDNPEEAVDDPNTLSDGARRLATALWLSGDHESATCVLAEFLQLHVGDCLTFNDFGVLLFSTGNYSAAELYFAKALNLDQDFAAALRGRAESLFRLRRYVEAISLLERYLEADPGNLGSRLTLAECLFELDRISEASNILQACINEKTGTRRLHLLMARIYQRQRLPGKLLTAVEAAIAEEPEDTELRAQLAFAYWEFGKIEDAIRVRDLVLKGGPISRALQFHLSWLSLHDPGQTSRGLRHIHQAAARKDSNSSLAKRGFSREPVAHGQRRVGYISGEFLGGPAFCFLASWLRHLDHSSFHSTFYSTRRGDSTKAMAFRRMPECWRDVSDLEVSDLVALIKREEIDILVDLSGHFDGNRLDVFEERPAPIQVTFPNYPGTTGVGQIDYILTDTWATPMGCEEDYIETPYRLPSGYLMYEPPCDLPRIEVLPVLSNGFITFGLFQRPGKYHAGFWDLVACVMRMSPGSRLLVHFASAELDDPQSDQRRFLTELLEARNVSRRRLIFKGPRVEVEHLQIVALADVALDSFPYNGQTTTCDCLWMGVPVVTLRGRTHVSRIGASLLDRIGLSRLVADSEEMYIRAVLHLISDYTALADLRSRLRQDAQRYLGDGLRLALEISDAYRWMWSTRMKCSRSATRTR